MDKVHRPDQPALDRQRKPVRNRHKFACRHPRRKRRQHVLSGARSWIRISHSIHRFIYTYTYAQPNSDADSDPDNPNTDTDSNTDCNTDADTDADNTDAYTDDNAESDADTDGNAWRAVRF